MILRDPAEGAPPTPAMKGPAMNGVHAHAPPISDPDLAAAILARFGYPSSKGSRDWNLAAWAMDVESFIDAHPMPRPEAGKWYRLGAAPGRWFAVGPHSTTRPDYWIFESHSGELIGADLSSNGWELIEEDAP